MTPFPLAMTSGAPLTRARAAMILLHGRGATAESMLELTDVFALPDMAYIAPQAPGNTWYPSSFLAPIDQNEPYLSRSLAAVRETVDGLSAQGFGGAMVLMGFRRAGASPWNLRRQRTPYGPSSDERGTHWSEIIPKPIRGRSEGRRLVGCGT